MKYIKKFESHNRLWELITYEEYLNYVGDEFKRLVELSDRDIEIIDELKGSFNLTLPSGYKLNKQGSIAVLSGRVDGLQTGRLEYIDGKKRNSQIYINIEVNKNDDDFYLLNIGIAYTTYILCDTIDGVISLLRDIIKQV